MSEKLGNQIHGQAIADVMDRPDGNTMSYEEYQKIEREIQLGQRDTLHDGTPIREFHKDLEELTREQNEARSKIIPKENTEGGIALVEEGVMPDKVKVYVHTNGARVADAVIKLPKSKAAQEEEEDLVGIPKDIPARDILISQGYTDVDRLRAMSVEEFVEIPGIGKSSASKLHKYLAK